MRLASGIAPVRRMLDAGVPVGLGVDGSASNDAGDLLAEARQALLLARVGRALEPPHGWPDGQIRYGCDAGPAQMTARDVLAIATRGGAAVLGRDDIGHLAPGMAADLAIVRPAHAGLCRRCGARPGGRAAALRHDARPPTRWSNGRVVVREGRLATLDLAPLVERHNRLARQLVA